MGFWVPALAGEENAALPGRHPPVSEWRPGDSAGRQVPAQPPAGRERDVRHHHLPARGGPAGRECAGPSAR